MLKTRRYDSALSSHFSFQPRTESVKSPARAVIAKSRARHVHVMSLNLLTSRKSPLFNLGLPMNRYTFVLPSENKNAFACSPSAQMPLVDQNLLQRYTRSFEIRRRVLRVKKMTKFKKNTHLSLSLSTCRSVDAL